VIDRGEPARRDRAPAAGRWCRTDPAQRRRDVIVDVQLTTCPQPGDQLGQERREPLTAGTPKVAQQDRNAPITSGP